MRCCTALQRRTCWQATTYAEHVATCREVSRKAAETQLSDRACSSSAPCKTASSSAEPCIVCVGRTNSYHINTESQLARCYNDVRCAAQSPSIAAAAELWLVVGVPDQAHSVCDWS